MTRPAHGPSEPVHLRISQREMDEDPIPDPIKSLLSRLTFSGVKRPRTERPPDTRPRPSERQKAIRNRTIFKLLEWSRRVQNTRIRSRIESPVGREDWSLWNYHYDRESPQWIYGGRTDLIPGPSCMVSRRASACFAAPSLESGHVSTRGLQSAHITTRAWASRFVYLDVGFWGGPKVSDGGRRDFALICGPHVWLCEFARTADKPRLGDGAHPDPFEERASELLFFVNDFVVVGRAMARKPGHAGVPSPSPSPTPIPSPAKAPIYLILPDLHMWPDIDALCGRDPRGGDPAVRLFLLDEERRLLRARRHPGPPPGPPLAARQGKGMYTMGKIEALGDHGRMQDERDRFAFGPEAAQDLIQLLRCARSFPELATESPGSLRVLQVGDLFEMWAPIAWAIDDIPFVWDETGHLRMSDTARTRIPRWIDLIDQSPVNRAVLGLLRDLRFHHIYGNHDVYLGLLEGSHPWRADLFFEDASIHAEHGHRFDLANDDGNLLGMFLCTEANRDPTIREIQDLIGDATYRLFHDNLPQAALYHLLAEGVIQPDGTPGSGRAFERPRPFNIFIQGHTHSPALLDVSVSIG